MVTVMLLGLTTAYLTGVFVSERILGGHLGLSTAELVVDGNRRVRTYDHPP